MTTTTNAAPPVPTSWELVKVPAFITLGITLVRLVGELLNWAPALFSKEAGGGGALVGISWLVPILGIYFAMRLIQAGHRPASGFRAIGFGVLGVAMMAAVGIGLSKSGVPQTTQLLAMFAVSAAVIPVVQKGWPELGRTLFAYGLAARIPVTLVMLVAIFANWGTHYDVPPPNFPEMSAFMKWVVIGLLPQMTFWMSFTVIVGMLTGGITALGYRRKTA